LGWSPMTRKYIIIGEIDARFFTWSLIFSMKIRSYSSLVTKRGEICPWGRSPFGIMVSL
jgi:hypothetical protein